MQSIWKAAIILLTSHHILFGQSIIFLVLNILDGYTTWLVMRPDHFERERNPIARWVFRKLKLPGAIIFFKALLLSFLGDFITYWWQEALTLNIGLLVGNLLYIYVVWHNYKVHRRYEKQDKQLQVILHYQVTSE